MLGPHTQVKKRRMLDLLLSVDPEGDMDCDVEDVRVGWNVVGKPAPVSLFVCSYSV